MSTELTVVVAAYLGFVAVLALVASLPAGRGLIQAARSGAVVGQVAVTLLTVVDLITVARGHRPDELTAHLGYALAAIGITPILLVQRAPETAQTPAQTREPASLPMVALAMLVTGVVVVRLGQTYR